MAGVLTLAEIKQQFVDEWVLVEEPMTDECLEYPREAGLSFRRSTGFWALIFFEGPS